jgi:hypothetical protein
VLDDIYDDEVWAKVHNNDIWIFDKLILSRKLGHLCGPAGIAVPASGNYVVRPCVNIMGMGRGASIQWIDSDTTHLPAGYFWQEVFVGDHLSVDYQDGVQVRCTQGFQTPGDLTRFNRWLLVDKNPVMPVVIKDFICVYYDVNIELINGRVIEVHLRGNGDFNDGAVEIIPIWCDQPQECPEGFVFVSDPDGDRVGFYKRYQ